MLQEPLFPIIECTWLRDIGRACARNKFIVDERTSSAPGYLYRLARAGKTEFGDVKDKSIGVPEKGYSRDAGVKPVVSPDVSSQIAFGDLVRKRFRTLLLCSSKVHGSRERKLIDGDSG